MNTVTQSGPTTTRLGQTCLKCVSLFLLIAFSLSFFAATPAQSQDTCYAVNNGDWSDASTWDDSETGDGSTNCADADGDGIPESGDTAIILDDVNVTVDVTTTVGNLTLRDGPSGGKTLMRENLTVEGNLSVGEATGSNALFRNYGIDSGDFTIDDTNIVTVEGNLTIYGEMLIERLASQSGSVRVGDGNVVTPNTLTIRDEGKLEFSSSTSEVVYGEAERLTNESGSESVTNRGLLLNGGKFVVTGITGSSTNSGYIDVGSGGLLNFNNSFTNASNGYLELSNSTLTIELGLENNGRFVTNSTSVEFADSLDNEISLNGDFFDTNAFDEVIVRAGNQPGGTTVDPNDEMRAGGAENPIQIDGNLLVESGAQFGFDDPGTEGVDERADIEYTGLTFASNGSLFANTVTLSPPSGTVTVSGAVFAEVFVSSNSDAEVGTNNFKVTGLVTIGTGASLDVQTSTLRLLGDFRVDGTLIADDGTVSFEGRGRQTCCSPGAPDGLGGPADKVQDVIGSASVTFDAVFVGDDPLDSGGNPIEDGDSVAETDVLISSGSLPVTVSTDLTVSEGTIRIGRPVTLQGSMTVNDDGDFKFTDTNRLFKFSGSSAQTVTTTTPLTFPLVEVSKSGGSSVTLNGQLTVPTRLTMTSGNLSSGGDLVLPQTGVFSDAFPEDNLPEQGLVEYAGSGSLNGSITGNVIVRRQFDGTTADWHMVTTPSPNLTFEQMLEEGGDNDLLTAGIPSSDAPGQVSPSVIYYDESITGDANGDGTADKGDGWVSIGDMQNTITEGRGFLTYVYDDDVVGDGAGFPKVIDSESTVSNSFSFDYTPLLDYTDTGDAAADGWNLIGNPYLAVIDWDDLALSNVNDAVYIYVPGGGYQEYSATSTDSGTLFADNGYIAPFQAFFVQANGTSPSVSIDDIVNDQVVNPTGDPFLKSQREYPPQVRLWVERNGEKEDVLFLFQDNADSQFDDGDAYELSLPEDQLLSFYSPLDNGNALSINNLPLQIEEEIRLPMATVAQGCANDSPFGGEVTMTWPTMKNLPADWGVALYDKEADQLIDLRDASNTEYTFILASNTAASECTTSKATADSGMPAPPAPQVLKHSSAKSSDGTRFELRIIPNATLPVEIGSFTGSADGNNASLEWTTLSESNNSGFFVQQKVDGRFQAVSSLIESAAPNGTTTEQQSYRFRAENLDRGTTHTFRLRQVDVDGSESFSKEIDIQIGIGEAYTLEAYPNPITSRQTPTVRFAVEKSQPVTVEVYNTLGQRVRTLYNDTPRTTGQFISLDLDASSLSSGVYFIRMQGESFTTTEKLVVVR